MFTVWTVRIVGVVTATAIVKCKDENHRTPFFGFVDFQNLLAGTIVFSLVVKNRTPVFGKEKNLRVHAQGRIFWTMGLGCFSDSVGSVG